MSSSVGMIIPNCNIWKHEKCSKPSAIFKYQIIIMTIGEYYILIKNYSLLIRGKLYSSWNTNMAAKATKVQQVIYGIGWSNGHNTPSTLRLWKAWSSLWRHPRRKFATHDVISPHGFLTSQHMVPCLTLRSWVGTFCQSTLSIDQPTKKLGFSQHEPNAS